jgi:hypothetical protein
MRTPLCIVLKRNVACIVEGWEIFFAVSMACLAEKSKVIAIFVNVRVMNMNKVQHEQNHKSTSDCREQHLHGHRSPDFKNFLLRSNDETGNLMQPETQTTQQSRGGTGYAKVRSRSNSEEVQTEEGLRRYHPCDE